ncbi:MAG: prepilin peptidase [Proteobacteria bacterium]|nr:prepilin peptidase [Pseudomonadota bacterium]NOG60106.1 prepilin peptidase [Pseudomonadota bacterium]
MSAIVELFNSSLVFYLGTIFILGLLVGSFLNVVIFRLPIMMERDWKEQCCELLELEAPEDNNDRKSLNLVTPRSRCPACNHQLKAIENIPVISYLFLKGKCSKCKNKISIRYPLIELVSAITVTVVAYNFGVSLQALFAICLTWALIALTMIDFDHQLLPDDITLPFLWLGIILNLDKFSIFTDLKSSVLGAIFGYGILWFVYITFKLITGKEGMGHGDFKLLAVLGAWFGYQFLPLIIIMSSLVGALIGITLMIFKSHNRSTAIPFGPYLAIAGWVSMLWGSDIMSAYLNAVI